MIQCNEQSFPHWHSLSGVVTLRRARIWDIRFLFLVRNYPQVRMWSLNTEPISRLDHLVWWLKHYFHREDVFVICSHGYRVGYLRLRRDPNANCYLSLAVHPTSQGRAFGSQALTLLVSSKRRWKAVRAWRAVIRNDNTASQRAFQTAGFRKLESTTEVPTGFLLMELT